MPFLKTLLFIILVPGTVVLLLPYLIAVALPATQTFSVGLLRYLAVLPWLSGTTVLLWCAWDFALKGQGTPAPVDPPKELVVEGLYRYVRNPMYVGVLLVVLGHVLWFGSLWLLVYGLGLFAAFHLFVLLYEEPNLKRRFGDAYLRYLQRVPRWIPRLRQD